MSKKQRLAWPDLPAAAQDIFMQELWERRREKLRTRGSLDEVAIHILSALLQIKVTTFVAGSVATCIHATHLTASELQFVSDVAHMGLHRTLYAT